MSKLAADLSVVTRVGLDLAKHVFFVHATDAGGKVVVARALRRREVSPFFAALPPCLVGMEACGSAHHWARELIALGHEVRLIPPAYVKPFVKRQKNDANDAAGGAVYAGGTAISTIGTGVKWLSGQDPLVTGAALLSVPTMTFGPFSQLAADTALSIATDRVVTDPCQ